MNWKKEFYLALAVGAGIAMVYLANPEVRAAVFSIFDFG